VVDGAPFEEGDGVTIIAPTTYSTRRSRGRPLWIVRWPCSVPLSWFNGATPAGAAISPAVEPARRRGAGSTAFALPQSSDSAHGMSTGGVSAILSFQLEISVYLFTSNWLVNLISLAVSGPLASSERWRR
jgi:hypothetical protein